jgi:hypothetical protein
MSLMNLSFNGDFPEDLPKPIRRLLRQYLHKLASIVLYQTDPFPKGLAALKNPSGMNWNRLGLSHDPALDLFG